jgi:hypothetical protein
MTTTESPALTRDTLLREAREHVRGCGPVPVLRVVEHWRRLHGAAIDGESDVHVGDALIAHSLSEVTARALRRLLCTLRCTVQSRWEAFECLAPADQEEPWLRLPGLPYAGQDCAHGWVSVLIHPERAA